MSSSAPQLPTRHLRDLTLTGGTPHLSAASGLVRIGQRLFVVADDECGLGVFDMSGDAPGRLFDWAAIRLPAGHAARKAAKPDYEALVRLPPHPAWPHGALLALGSGSRPNRERGALLPLDSAGNLGSGAIRDVDLAPLYGVLRGVVGELNIEGALFVGGCFTLLQRAAGNRGNAGLSFDAAVFTEWLAGGGPLPLLSGHFGVELGQLAGVPLALTDGAALGTDGSRWVFSAAAEDTADSYNDGACVGSVLGIADRSGAVLRQWRLDAVCKIEGVAVLAGAPWQLLLVTDADDRRQPARLLACTLPTDA